MDEVKNPLAKQEASVKDEEITYDAQLADQNM